MGFMQRASTLGVLTYCLSSSSLRYSFEALPEGVWMKGYAVIDTTPAKSHLKVP